MLSKLHGWFPGFILGTIMLLAPASVLGQHGWPVDPANSDHPLGNTTGEYYYGLLHAGIDLMELPMYDSSDNVDPAAPWVIVTVAGDVTRLDNLTGRYNFTIVDPTDAAHPAEYWYGHLQKDSYSPDYVNAFDLGTTVSSGDSIAKIVRWNQCDFHHVHYELQDGNTYINPLAEITPNPDEDPPEVEEIFFAKDNSDPWDQLNPVAAGSCAVVTSPADILVQFRDRDEAGASLGDIGEIGVYNMRWRACPDTNANCAWQNTRPFDTMPMAWYSATSAAVAAMFSKRTPWISNTSYCDAGWDYAIVTNYVGGMPDVAGKWDTTAITDGSYSVSAEVTDFAGNVTIINRRACVQNTSTCTTELTIRDNTEDQGAIPHFIRPWWYSPDITVNPGTPDEDHNVNLGVTNSIEVRVWNYGSCKLPAGATYDVCLGWGLATATVAYPLPPNQQAGCQTETVPAGAWEVGASRTTTITWTPDPSLVPVGSGYCLIAWVDMSPDDPVLDTPAVNFDDNRAQQNITFVAAPTPGEPGFSSFWVNPQRMIKRRSLELKFRYSGNRTTLREVRLHVLPGLIVERVVGGSVVGVYQGDKPIEPCDLKPEEFHRMMCQSWKDSSKLGYTRVIGGIDPSGRLLMEGLHVTGEPVRMTLEVWSEDGVRKGEFVDIEVVENGILPGNKEVTPVGGLTIRFEH